MERMGLSPDNLHRMLSVLGASPGADVSSGGERSNLCRTLSVPFASGTVFLSRELSLSVYPLPSIDRQVKEWNAPSADFNYLHYDSAQLVLYQMRDFDVHVWLETARDILPTAVGILIPG